MKLYKLPVDLKEDKDLDAFYKTNSNKIMDVNLFYREIEKNKESFFGISEIYAYMSMAWKAAREHYQPKWISVDDALPNKRDLVLACDHRYIPVACQYDENSRDGRLLFFTMSNFFLDGGNVFHPTHWMPLPKPPID